jgi:hypothetical protein
METDDIFTYVAGGAILLVVGFVVYQIFVNRNVQSVSSIVPTSSTSPDFAGFGSHRDYYKDIPGLTAKDILKSNKPVVENEENIRWTDWLGRERVITISRKVH